MEQLVYTPFVKFKGTEITMNKELKPTIDMLNN